jgi:uncharacterized protein
MRNFGFGTLAHDRDNPAPHMLRDVQRFSVPLRGVMLYGGRVTLIPVMTPVLSPCEKICIVDPGSGLCQGCGRSLREIESWTSCSDAERNRVMSELPGRLQAMRAGGPNTAKP